MTVKLADTPVDLSEIAEIELFVLRRMKDLTLGAHTSVVKGSGFNFVGMRDWEPGDRLSSIDWAQSSLTNFSHVISREFEQNSTATVMAVADASLSTRCGARGVSIASCVARAIATLGLSAVLLQDLFGLITFGEEGDLRDATPARLSKSHVLYCLDLYQRGGMGVGFSGRSSVTESIRHLRQRSLVPVISDFLFSGAAAFIRELASLNATHDLFLVLVDAAFAYQLPPASAGWIDLVDIETGHAQVVSRREFLQLAARIREWQAGIRRIALDADLEIVQVGLDRWEMETALVQFFGDRRLQKVR